jgi:hypothetical protein
VPVPVISAGMGSATAMAGGADASVGGASMLLTMEAGAATSPTWPSGTFASAEGVMFTPLSETALSTTEAVVCEVSEQAKELLKENAT